MQKKEQQNQLGQVQLLSESPEGIMLIFFLK